MNALYTDLIIAFLLAQSLFASIQVYDYQKAKNIKYLTALYAYFSAEVGYFIIGFIGILCLCFLLPLFIDLRITREDLLSLEKLNWKQQVQLYFKAVAFSVGGFVQYIAFKYKSKGKIAIDNVADKIVP